MQTFSCTQSKTTNTSCNNQIMVDDIVKLKRLRAIISNQTNSISHAVMMDYVLKTQCMFQRHNEY